MSSVSAATVLLGLFVGFLLAWVVFVIHIGFRSLLYHRCVPVFLQYTVGALWYILWFFFTSLGILDTTLDESLSYDETVCIIMLLCWVYLGTISSMFCDRWDGCTTERLCEIRLRRNSPRLYDGVEPDITVSPLHYGTDLSSA
jgi:hypothetical protein